MSDRRSGVVELLGQRGGRQGLEILHDEAVWRPGQGRRKVGVSKVVLLKLTLTRIPPSVDEVPSYRPKLWQCSESAIRIGSNDDTVLHEVCNLPDVRVGRQNVRAWQWRCQI